MGNLDRLKSKLKNAANSVEVKTIVPLGNEASSNDKSNKDLILTQELVDVDILKIESNPFQPRTKFEDIDELAENIFTHGLLQPITVYFNNIDNKYYIIAGERRSRAIKFLFENNKIKNTIYKVNLVKNLLSDDDKRILATLENTHRANMTIIDMANNAYSYVQTGKSYSEIAELFSVGKTVISRYVKIASLPIEVQDILNTREVKSPNKIEMLTAIKDLKIQIEFAHLILEDISISGLEMKLKKYIKSIKDDTNISTSILETPFDKVKPISKILSKAKYRKLTELHKTQADEILEEIFKLQQKLADFS